MTGSRAPKRQHEHLWNAPRWGRVVFAFCVLIAALVPIPRLYTNLQRETRGVVYGIPPAIPHTDVNPFAVNVDLVPLSDADLARALALLTDAGFGWVRLRFPWFAMEPRPGEYNWAPWDRVVRGLQQRGIGIIALIDGTPTWQRPPGEEDNPVVPPVDLDALAEFAAQVARRYGDAIDYYQVWDQPNVSPFWGNERVDPAGYVAMLRRVGQAIKRADGTAFILSAGLAPTPLHEPNNFSDVDYLDAMYKAGARDAFDILGAKAYDLEGGDPWSRDYDPNRLGVARLVLLREVMLRHGDDKKPIWVVGWGRHATPPGWTGRPSIWGTVTEKEQAQYVYEVFRRKRREWPWLGVLTWDQFYPQVPPDDPLWGFALLRPNWEPRPVYFAFQDLATGAPFIGTGRYGPESWIWQRPDSELRHTLLIDATHIGLVATKLVAVEASLDGEERSALVEPGSEYVLGDQLSLSPHTLTLRLDPPGVTTLIVGRNRPLAPYLALGFLAFLALVAAGRLVLWAHLPQGEPVIWPGLILVLLGFLVYSPVLFMNLITLALLLLLFIYRPHWGPVTSLLLLPVIPYTKPLGPWRFSLVEISLVLSAVAWGAHLAFRAIVAALEPERVRWSVRVRLAWATIVEPLLPRTAFDAMALLFLAIGLWATLYARYQAVAWREFRWVIVEPILFYWMVRTWWREEIDRAIRPARQRLRTWLQHYAYRRRVEDDVRRVGLLLAHSLLWGGIVAVALGIVLFLQEGGVVYAEGVWRLRGLYGSPNNMALFLGRAAALSLALALFWPVTADVQAPFYVLRSRRGFLILALAIGLGLVGTFSRGALILGVPLTLLFLTWRAPRRWRRYLLVSLAILLVSLLPFWTTERFRSLVTGTGTLAIRFELWLASLRMLRDHWFTGVGPDNFLYYFRSEYLPPRYPEPNLSHPHNIVLHYWLALGLPGLIWLISLLGLYARATCDLIACLPDNSLSRALLEGSLAITVYGVAHGLVDQSFLLPDLALIFWFGIAVVASLQERLGLPAR